MKLECEVCGWGMRRSSEHYEAWGRSFYEPIYECVNPNCGEEEEEDEEE